MWFFDTHKWNCIIDSRIMWIKNNKISNAKFI